MKNSSLTLGVKNCVINGSSTRVFKYFNGALSCFNWMVANVWECAARECLFFFYFVLFYFSCPCSVPIGLKHLNVLPFLSRSIETLRSRDVELFKLQEKFGLDINKCFLPACLPGSLDFEKKIIMWMCFRWEKKKKKRFVSCRLSEDAVQFCVILMNDCQFCCACVFFFVCLYLHSEIFWENSLAYLMFFLSACTLTPSHAATLGDETLITKSV